MLLKELLIDALKNSNTYDEFYNRLLCKYQYILESLSNVPQWYHWHPEIDVATHTYYVCKALYNQKQYDLLEAGFFHDIGKLWTTNVGAKKIWHYGHAQESYKYIDENFKCFDFDQQYLEFTKEIILHHMDNLSKDVVKVSNVLLDQNVFYTALKNFQYADKVLSKELYLKETPFYKRWNNYFQQKWMFFKKRYNPDGIIYVMVGISGSGKSTFAKRFFLEDQIVSSDAIRKNIFGNVNNQNVNKKVFELAHNMLLAKANLYNKAVLDATNVDRGLRIEFFGKNNRYNKMKKVALVIDCDIDIAYGRVCKDIENKKDRSNVPYKAIQRQANKFNKGLVLLWDEFEEVKFWDEYKQKFINYRDDSLTREGI